MKIAMIASEKLPVPPIRGGAVQTYIEAMARRIAANHDVTVVGICDRDLPDEEVRDGVRYVRIRCVPNDLESYARGLVERLRGEAFDVIEVFNRPLLVLPLHKACPASRMVLSLHNEMFRETKIPVELGRATLDVLERIVTVSDYIKGSLVSRYPEAESKTKALYSGVSLDRFVDRTAPEAKDISVAVRRELGIGKDAPIILYVGRMSKSKGPDRILDALPIVLERIPQATLVMVGSKWFGSDDSDAYVRELRRRGEALRDHIAFTGYVPYDRVHRYYIAADVFVCPSQWSEPLARVHYEAMAAGLPIVTTHRGGNAEVVQTNVNGIVVEAWDQPEAFARAILDILENPKKARELGMVGRTIVTKHFTWDRVARDLEHELLKAAKSDTKEAPEEVAFDSGALAAVDADYRELYDEDRIADTVRKLRQRSRVACELFDEDFGALDDADGLDVPQSVKHRVAEFWLKLWSSDIE